MALLRWKTIPRILLYSALVFTAYIILHLSLSSDKDPVFSHDKVRVAGHDLAGAKLDRPAIPVAVKDKALANKVTHGTKRILMWTTFYGQHINTDFKCPVASCEMTNNKTLLNQSDAVIVHMWDISGVSDLPATRLPDQRWIFYSMEPPPRLRRKALDVKEFNGFFNTTMTYRLDSDIKRVYGWLKPLKDDEKKTLSLPKNFAAKKNKTVAWFVSNCHDSSKRLDYTREMQKYLPVDIFGECGPLTCSREHPEDRRGCMALLNTTYKFYLAFENSFCKDYVTEKLWNIMLLHISVIPIVLSGFDYHKHLPPNSYIDVRDFPSPKALTDHIKRVDANDTLFNEYFEWQKEYKYSWTYKDHSSFCDLCKYLHDNENIHKTYSNLHDWWESDACVAPNEFYKGVADMLVKS